MRKILAALTIAAFSTGLAMSTADAAKAPAKTKLGCIKGKEKWNAGVGKCEAVKKKPVKKAAKKPKK